MSVDWEAQRREEAKKFENWDPNDPFSMEDALWMVYTGGRDLKLHTSRGPALNKLRNSGRAKLFELVNGRWELRAVKGEPKTKCDSCGRSTIVQEQTWSYQRPAPGQPLQRVPTGYRDMNYGKWDFERHGRKIVEPLNLRFLCRACQG